MRIGPKKQYTKQESLLDWMDQYGGNGMSGWQEWGLPDDGMDFVQSQFTRFRLPFDGNIEELVERAAYHVFWYTDWADPYCLLLQYSDIAFTDQWERNGYEIQLQNGVLLAEPEKLETYAFVPGQAEHWFNYFYVRPGLRELPRGIGETLEGELKDSLENHEYWSDNWRDIIKSCGENVDQYMCLAAWATFIWLAGPLGRDFRMETNLLHDVVNTHKEGIIYDGEIISPKMYKRYDVPRNACRQCGLDSYCNELVEMGGVPQYLCEHCLNGGLILFPGANCGSRVCKYVECPHHLYHSEDRLTGLYQTLRGTGLLEKKKQQLIA
jgi:hypothetical protein